LTGRCDGRFNCRRVDNCQGCRVDPCASTSPVVRNWF